MRVTEVLLIIARQQKKNARKFTSAFWSSRNERTYVLSGVHVICNLKVWHMLLDGVCEFGGGEAHRVHVVRSQLQLLLWYDLKQKSQ